MMLNIFTDCFQQFPIGKKLFVFNELCARLNKERSSREPPGISNKDILPLPVAARLLVFTVCRLLIFQGYHGAGKYGWE